MKRNFKLLVATLVLVVMVFTLASCAQVQGIIDKFMPHEHEYSAEWSSDETNHWHAAICEKGEECLSAIADLAAHEIVDGACSVCGYKAPAQGEKPAPECKNHAWSGGYTVIKAPTCTEKGSNEHTCLICGEKGELEVSELGHSADKLPGTAPTCTEPGISSGSYCTVCKEVLVEQTMIPATGHNYVKGICSTCGAEDPNYDPHVTYNFDCTTDLSDYTTDKTNLVDGTTFTNGYFTIVGGSNQVRVGKSSGLAYAIDIAKDATGAIQFTVTGTATITIVVSSTGDENTSLFGIIDLDGNLVIDEAVVVTGSTSAKVTLEYTLSAGTYQIVSPVTDDEAYNRAVRIHGVKVVELPPEEFVVETTDTYGYFDEYSFTAEAEGYYTFTLPAGLGFYSQAKFDSFAAPELDFYDNANGGTVVLGLKAGETIVFYVGAITRDTWTMTWTFKAGEVEDNTQGGGSSDATDLYVGSNTVTLTGDDISNGKTFNFVVTEEGDYTFACDFLAVVSDATGMQIGRGQVYLTPGNYTVTLVSIMAMPAGNYTVRVEYTAPASGEPDGSEEFPYIWETIPESVVVDYSVISGKVYYIFTATADGSITFSWPIEGDSWYDIFELDANGNLGQNNASGGMADSHSFVVEAGKSYRVSLGSWSEAGSHTITIDFSACAHEWSEATCEALSTCSKCGATTGDYADHIPNSAEPTCDNPAECTVCGAEVGYVDHTLDDGVINTPADCATETNGSITYTCTVCGHEETETLWASHEWDRSQCVEATCTTDGKYHAVCTVCGTVESYDIEAEGHYNWYATCGDTTTCMACSEEFTVEHDLFPADCFSPAMCSICWQTFGEPLPHNFVDGVCTECYFEDPNYLADTYTVTGSGSLCGTDWNYNVTDNDMILGDDGLLTKTFEKVAAGKHEFKIIKNRAWADEGGAEYPSTNFAFYVATEGSKVVITLDLATGKVRCYVYAPDSETPVECDGDMYLVVGDSGLCGDVVNTENEGWGWEFENLANLLTLKADGKYEIVYNGVKAGEYGIKVVKNFSWNNAWGGTTTDNFIIKVEKDNSKVTVTFDPATGISYSVEAPHVHSYFYPCDKVCQECFEESNPNAAHTIVAVEAKAATCTENGNIAYWYCSDCGYAWADEALTQVTNQKSVIIPAAHTYTYVCDKICAVCFEETNPDAAHTIVAVEAKAATCTVDGNIAYWYCSDCGYAWADEALTKVTNQMSIVAPATGHADDNGDFKCDGCAITMLPADGEALTIPQALAIAKMQAHDTYTYEKYYITGIVKSVYNTTYGNLYLVDDEGNEITIYGLYTWGDGSTDGTRYDKMDYKPVAGDELTVYTKLGMYNSTAQGKNAWIDEVVAHEHNYTSVVTDPTCVQDGYTTHTCSICKNFYNDSEVEAFGHTFEDGKCSICGAAESPSDKTETSVSKSHTEIASIAGVTAGQNTGVIANKTIKLNNDISIVCAKGKSTSDPCIYSESIRLYQGGATLTIKAAEGCDMTTIVLKLANGNTAGDGPISVNGGTASALSNYTYTITVDPGVSEVVITTTGTDKNSRLYVANIEVVYEK